MRAFRYAVLFAALLSCSAQAAEKTENVKAKDLIELAITRSPQLRSLSFASEALRHSADQTSRWSNPHLELGGERKEEREGDTQFTKIGFSKTIERPGKSRALNDLAKSRAELATFERGFSEIELRGRVLLLIYEYKVANEKATHAKERFERFKTAGTYLRSRVFASPQKRAEASIVRGKLMVLGRTLRSLEAERKTAWLRLNLYLGLNAEPRIAAAWYKSGPTVPLESLLTQLSSSHPELKRQAQQMQILESDLELAQMDNWPELTLAGSFANCTGANPEKVYGLGISIPIPVFNGNGSAVTAQQNFLAAGQEQRKWLTDQATQEIRAAYEQYIAAQLSVAEFGMERLPELEREMTAIDTGFKKGQVDLLTYIEADAEHAESLDAVLDTQLDFISAQNSLFLLVGQAPQILE